MADKFAGIGWLKWIFTLTKRRLYVSIDNSPDGLDFELSIYYCTINWDPVPVPLFSGHTKY